MSEFKAGQKVRVSEDATWGYSRTSAVRGIFLGEVVTVEAGPDSDNDYIVVNEAGADGYVGAEFLTPAGFKAGQRVRVAKGATYHYDTASASAGSEATVRLDGLDADGDVVLNFGGAYDWAAPEFVTLVEDEEPQTDDFQPGDRVRATDPGNNKPVEVGDTGTVTLVMPSNVPGANYLVMVDWDSGERAGLFDTRLEKAEKVEVTEGDNDTEDDSPVGEVPAVSLTGEGLVISGPLSFAGVTVDVVNHPPHYKFSNAEVIDITEHLTFNGGNAVKYVARSTRQDGQNKGNVLEDLRKARWYIDREIERIENGQG